MWLWMVQKNAYIHVLVSWPPKVALSLNVLWAVKPIEVAQSRQLFCEETKLYRAMSATASGRLSAGPDETPLNIACTASNASSSTNQQSWHSRTPIHFFGKDTLHHSGPSARLRGRCYVVVGGGECTICGPSSGVAALSPDASSVRRSEDYVCGCVVHPFGA